MFLKNHAATVQKFSRKGTVVGTDFFLSLEPFELNFPNLNCRVRIVTGTKDKYCPSHFVKYLEASVVKKSNFEFKSVDGAEHEVDEHSPPEVQQQYVEKLFAD